MTNNDRAEMRKIKPPRLPLCLCNNVAEWAFGIVSPSKFYFYKGQTDRERCEIERYFASLQAYRKYEWEQRVAARKVTKEEWRVHYRSQRIAARELRAQKAFDEAMQKIKDCALNTGAAIRTAIEKMAAEINEKMQEVNE